MRQRRHTANFDVYFFLNRRFLMLVGVFQMNMPRVPVYASRFGSSKLYYFLFTYCVCTAYSIQHTLHCITHTHLADYTWAAKTNMRKCYSSYAVVLVYLPYFWRVHIYTRTFSSLCWWVVIVLEAFRCEFTLVEYVNFRISM